MEQTNGNLSIPLTCGKCGSNNSVFVHNLTSTTRCRTCRAIVTPVAEPVCVGASSIVDLLEGAKVPVLAVFFDLRSGPCRVAAPDVNLLAHKVAGRALVVKVDAGACPELAIACGAHSFPYFLLLKGSERMLEHHGAAHETEMRRWLQPVTQSDGCLRPSRMAGFIDRYMRLLQGAQTMFWPWIRSGVRVQST